MPPSADAGTIAFAMNGGAYGDDLKAVGYYVETASACRIWIVATERGNFYMKPNGVFFGTGATWRVTGERFLFFATVGERPRIRHAVPARCW